MSKRFGVIQLSHTLLLQFLHDHMMLPADLDIIDVKYDGFRRVIDIATMTATDDEQFYACPEGAQIPTIRLVPKVVPK